MPCVPDSRSAGRLGGRSGLMYSRFGLFFFVPAGGRNPGPESYY